MTEDERIDAMTEQASLAFQTETGKRLLSACATDALVNRIIGPDNPDYVTIAKSMTGDAIVEAANREYDDLDDTQRTQLAAAAVDHVQQHVVAAVKHSWVVCDALQADPTTVPPETIAFIAAMRAIPADAIHPSSSRA